MPICGAGSILVRGTVKSLKWRPVFTKARYSTHCSSSLCCKPCHASSALGSPGRTSMPMTLLSSLNRSRNMSGGSWLGKKQWRRKDRKMKIMICGMGLDLLQSSGEFPCAVCPTRVGSSSIYCNGCKHWVHKKCSGLKRLTEDPDYRCTWCQGTAWPLGGRPQREVQVGPDKLEVVASFCYPGDMLSAAGGCELSTITCVKTTWNKFKELLPVLSSRHLSFKTHGRMYSSYLRSAVLHASETWPLTKPNLQSQQQNDWSMIRQRSTMSSCKILSPPDPVSCLHGLALRIWTSFWRREDSAGMDMWYAPVVQSRQPLTYRLMESFGLAGSRWHVSSWQRGIAESGSSGLSNLMIDIPGGLMWDLPCMQQLGYLERDPLMWMLPLYLHVNKNPMTMMMIFSEDDTFIKQQQLMVLSKLNRNPSYQLRLRVWGEILQDLKNKYWRP